MKRLIALILALCLILCGCAGSGNEETTEDTTETTEDTSETTETTEDVPETTVEIPETTVETDPPIVYTNPLTGEVVDAEFTVRPIAIMLNNHKVALPHHGVSAADIIYEACVEGGMTRYMAIFTDVAAAGPIGSVRSCRPPFVDIVQGYDAIYSSAGGDSRVIASVNNAGINYINALSSKYFYRDQARMQKVAYEHCLFIKGADLLQLAKDKGYRTTANADKNYGLIFNDDAVVSGEAVNSVTIYFTKGGKTTTAIYHADLDGYTLNQYNIDYVDGNTGEKVVFSNVIILNASWYTINDGKHVQMDTVGSGTGWYLRDGQLMQINWSRSSATAPFTYTYADGTQVEFASGRTYVAVTAKTAGIDY